MYVERLEGLSERKEMRCPASISTEDIRFLLRALDNRADYSDKRRIHKVTDAMFIRRHPERFNKRTMKIIPLPSVASANSEEQMLIVEWLHMRNCFVMPVHRAWLKFWKK